MMAEVIIVRHTILVFEMYLAKDKLNLPLNLSSIKELVYICYENRMIKTNIILIYYDALIFTGVY